ncbi:MAG: hypothetical protein B7Y12_02045 [Rhizobiales bacterium 24-66-13]|jgi:hypothetical protein|nr:MAG: hypothetical protein B7Z41_04140 [Rhizobiales bacterium 12-66-7]OYY88803.1 MAG: hypothetical protein B7Y61_01075 [Rhizobiales bacterium 35-66-30]OYZ82797.1 MAG: hypothetical protein B7Y12_02045 [Rhizobiales bacterium 24-66-13]OZB11830.1 MAG: hypothetical protein B7X67_02025 [Rhizobiales bacterium 39-66-18]HQS09497.1 hypothetical protein [Xanthobacteraceae bacterium]
MIYLILDAATAALVRGPTAPGYGLDPVPLLDGSGWILPAICATAPEHAMHHQVLATMPVRPVADAEWQQDEELP